MSEENKSGGNQRLIKGLLIFLAITNAVTLYFLFTTHQENVEIVTQNMDLTSEKV
jgi:hypothetical protein